MDEIEDLKVFSTNFTEIIYQRGRVKAQLTPIIDHRSKIAASHALGPNKDTGLAPEAWHRALNCRKPYWLSTVVVKSKARISYLDASGACTRNRSTDDSRKKIGTCFSKKKISTHSSVVAEEIRCYNFNRRHSALGNLSPMEYLKKKGLKTL